MGPWNADLVVWGVCGLLMALALAIFWKACFGGSGGGSGGGRKWKNPLDDWDPGKK